MVDISARLQFYKIIIDTFSLDEPITLRFSSWSANLMMFNSDVIQIYLFPRVYQCIIMWSSFKIYLYLITLSF